MHRAPTFALLLLTVLILSATPLSLAHAGEASVKCALRADWDDKKSGSLQEFPIAGFEDEGWNNYREHCDFSSTQFLFLRGRIDRELENAVKRFHVALLADPVIQKTWARNPGHGFIVFLSSGGGSVNAALRLGRVIRKMQSSVFVDGNCLSSCVFILAGGVRRHVEGSIGVHRPYLAPHVTDAPPGESEQHSGPGRKAVLAYLYEMSIPASLHELMERTPSHSMHILSKQELGEYQLDDSKLAVSEPPPAEKKAFVNDATSGESAENPAGEDALYGSSEEVVRRGRW